MNTNEPKIETTSASRRDFLKTSATVAGTVLIGALDVGRFAHAAESSTLKPAWLAAADAAPAQPATR